jgi:membrane protease YdiL (CAAX protease family)
LENHNSNITPHLNHCPNCGNRLPANALYCGNCGHPVSTFNQDNTPVDQTALIPAQQSPWQCISPAISLWIGLLAINGVLGLCGHISDISSPCFDLGAQIISALLILIFWIRSRQELNPLICRSGFKGIFTLFELIAAILFIYVLMWFYLKVASFIGIEKILYLTDFKKHNWPLWSAFILISILPGIFEELAFRGHIMTRLEKVGNTREALIIQAAMFSVLHMLPTIFISHFIIGLTLGIIRLRSKSLYPGMIIHAAWNAIVILEEIYTMAI